MDTLNMVMSLLLSFCAGWAVMSRKVRDGILVKCGLVLVSLGFLGDVFLSINPAGMSATALARVLISVGLMICVVGYLLRVRKRSRFAETRRITDWVDLA